MGVGARDDHVAGLDRLAQGLEDGAGELRQLVEEEDAVMGAGLISPGLAPRPPPTIAAIEAVWCGVRKGRAREMPPSSRRPAREWIIEVSSASEGSRGGRMPGRRAASIDLPLPGGPTMRRWWRPAAAISRARFSLPSPGPLTSAKYLLLATASGNRAGLGGREHRPAGEVVDEGEEGLRRDDLDGADPGRLRGRRRPGI